MKSPCEFQWLVEICDVNSLSSNMSFQKFNSSFIERLANSLLFEDHSELVSLIDLFSKKFILKFKFGINFLQPHNLIPFTIVDNIGIFGWFVYLWFSFWFSTSSTFCTCVFWLRSMFRRRIFFKCFWLTFGELMRVFLNFFLIMDCLIMKISLEIFLIFCSDFFHVQKEISIHIIWKFLTFHGFSENISD